MNNSSNKTSRKAVSAAEAAVGNTKMKKFKSLIVNGCETKSPISTEMEHLNLCHDGTNASVCSGTVLKNNNAVGGKRELHLVLK